MSSDTSLWQPGHLRRVVLASLIGTTIEWYDFFLYGSAAALIFNKLFFPQYDPLTGTLEVATPAGRSSLQKQIEPLDYETECHHGDGRAHPGQECALVRLREAGIGCLHAVILTEDEAA